MSITTNKTRREAHLYLLTPKTRARLPVSKEGEKVEGARRKSWGHHEVELGHGLETFNQWTKELRTRVIVVEMYSLLKLRNPDLFLPGGAQQKWNEQQKESRSAIGGKKRITEREQIFAVGLRSGDILLLGRNARAAPCCSCSGVVVVALGDVATSRGRFCRCRCAGGSACAQSVQVLPSNLDILAANVLINQEKALELDPGDSASDEATGQADSQVDRQLGRRTAAGRI
ncbi:hypothetical protein PoB_003666000 [Plakobranchus ocellatus]|uniref:Uncharacterized protein n=1 Tax=Plakobranchus ocellatus TaxID=259542 RepID=A0AAV4ATC9_9GAST|nr:hypothetical protein PoB_003666000 [Plakobranchus ocellatus]